VCATDYPSINIAQGETIENFVDKYNKALAMTTLHDFRAWPCTILDARGPDCRSRRDQHHS
jgi:hypothetical protein